MSGSGFAQFIPLILIFVIFYFFLIRPQQKKIKDHKNMVSALKRGDDIITSGGIVGRIEKVNDENLTGKYFDVRKISDSHEYSYNEEDQKELFDLSKKLLLDRKIF